MMKFFKVLRFKRMFFWLGSDGTTRHIPVMKDGGSPLSGFFKLIQRYLNFAG